MYTLKIHWWREEHIENSNVVKLADETTLFIEADEIRVHGTILNPVEEMTHWIDADTGHPNNGTPFLNYQSTSPDGRYAARLIQVIRDGADMWYLASKAWLLGPTGDTIERIAP